MSEPTLESRAAHIARLEGRIAALESALERRSRELRLLQGSLCSTDLVQLARIADGLPPVPLIAHQLEYWTETTEILPANLESTLEDLWASLTPSPASILARNPALSSAWAGISTSAWPEVPTGSPE